MVWEGMIGKEEEINDQGTLQEISYFITNGLNRMKSSHKTMVVAIDTVNHEILVNKISNL